MLPGVSLPFILIVVSVAAGAEGSKAGVFTSQNAPADGKWHIYICDGGRASPEAGSADSRIRVESSPADPETESTLLLQSFAYAEMPVSSANRQLGREAQESHWMHNGIAIDLVASPAKGGELHGTHALVSFRDLKGEREDARDVEIKPGTSTVIAYSAPSRSTLSVTIVGMGGITAADDFSSEYRSGVFTILSRDRTIRISENGAGHPQEFHDALVRIHLSSGVETVRASRIRYVPGTLEMLAEDAVLTGNSGERLAKERRLRIWIEDGRLRFSPTSQ